LKRWVKLKESKQPLGLFGGLKMMKDLLDCYNKASSILTQIMKGIEEVAKGTEVEVKLKFS